MSPGIPKWKPSQTKGLCRITMMRTKIQNNGLNICAWLHRPLLLLLLFIFGRISWTFFILYRLSYTDDFDFLFRCCIGFPTARICCFRINLSSCRRRWKRKICGAIGKPKIFHFTGSMPFAEPKHMLLHLYIEACRTIYRDTDSAWKSPTESKRSWREK